MEALLRKILVLVILTPAAYLALTWNNLPVKPAMHFDIGGHVDRYGSKKELLVMVCLLTLLNAGIYFLLCKAYLIDPRKNAADNKERMQRIAFVVSVFITCVLCLMIYSSVHGNIKFSARLLLAAVGLLFAFMGNYMHSMKPNYFAGLRLPWTLQNEDNWRRTHLLAGKLWFGGGLLIAVLCMFLPLEISIPAIFVVTVPLVAIPCVFSYRLYKRQSGGGNKQ